MKKILLVLGTRPEAIKLIPVIDELRASDIPFEVLNTAQHTEITDSVLKRNRIQPDYKLSVYGKYKELGVAKSEMLREICNIVNIENVSLVMVQGDTLSALVGAEFGFLNNIPVYHVEAGMRTYNKSNPYPEDVFRRMISCMATLHFCPSKKERQNLIDEHIDDKDIYVTGNTFVDYRLHNSSSKVRCSDNVLITLHRRENIPHIYNILDQIAKLAAELPRYKWLFPIHPNPPLVDAAKQILGNIPNATLCAPLDDDEFYAELLRSSLVITDSGGVQEECLINRKKVLIVREYSERVTDFDFIETVNPSSSDLCEKFYSLLKRKINDSNIPDCYGSGDAAKKIVKIIIERGMV